MSESVQVQSGAGFREAQEAGVQIPLSPEAAQYVSSVDAAGDALATLRKKGLQTQTISSGGTTGSTAVTLSAGAVPPVGAVAYFTDQTFEAHRVIAVAGQVLTLDAALTSTSTHTAIQWDIGADNGPKANPLTPGSVPLQAPALYDPTATEYFAGQGIGGAALAVPAAKVGGGATHKNIRNLVGTAQSLKSSAGTLYGLQIYNGAGAAAFVQLFDLATGGVTPGTTAPDFEVEVASAAYLNVPLPACGIAFTTAISAISATAEGGGTGSATGLILFAQVA